MMKILVQFGQGFDWASLGFSNAEQFGFTVPRGCTGADLKQQISDLCGGALQPGHFRLHFVDSDNELVDCEDGALANTSNFQPQPLTLTKHGVKSGSVLVVDVLLSQDEAAMYALDVEDVDVEMEGGLDQPPAQGAAEARAPSPAPVKPCAGGDAGDARTPMTVGTIGTAAPTEDDGSEGSSMRTAVEEGEEEEEEDDTLGLGTTVNSRRIPGRGAAAAAAIAAATPAPTANAEPGPAVAGTAAALRGVGAAAPASASATAPVGVPVDGGAAAAQAPSLVRSPVRQSQQPQQQQASGTAAAAAVPVAQPQPRQHQHPPPQPQRPPQPQPQPQHAPVHVGAYGPPASSGHVSTDSFLRSPEVTRPLKNGRGHWSLSEVEMLVSAVEKYGKRWSNIEEQVGFRSQIDMREKWRNLSKCSKNKWAEMRGLQLPKALRSRIDTLV